MRSGMEPKDLDQPLHARRLRFSCPERAGAPVCTLTLIGTEDEVIAAAVWHAVNAHGRDDTPELRARVRSALREVTPGEAT
jgi:hypothetical protein